MIPFLHIGISFAFFAIIFFLSRRPFRLEDKVASAFLFFLGFPMLIKLIIIGALNIPLPDIILSIKSYPFTYGPFLYFYTTFEIDPKPVFKKIYLLHFLPFILFAVLPFIFPEFDPVQPGKIIERRYEIENRYNNLTPPPDIQKKSEMPAAGLMPPPGIHENISFPEPPDLNMMMYFTLLLVVISFLVYTTLILLLLQRHKKNISEYFSYDSIMLNLKWLQWVTLCFVIAYLFVFLSAQITPEIYAHPFLDRRISPDIALTFFIFAFSFFAVKQPVIFRNMDKAESNGYINKEKLKKYEKSGLKTAEAENYLDTIEQFMGAEKPYLECDLTILDVSRRLDIPRHHLTQVINERLRKNFFMYINEYRVNEARQMMTDENYKDYTILRIAYESGFNSKSGFNTVFKKLTGYTPTEYRKKASSGV
ncbi:MAG: AraC family transcriptional regulator [Spirochaetota bacterium]